MSNRTKLDKIFDNRFHEVERNENDKIDLHSEFFIEEGNNSNPYNSLIVDELMNKIDNLISLRFPEYKVINNGKAKKINKNDINIVYKFIIDNIPQDFTIIDTWYYLSVYFDVDSKRFYASLNDEYKSQLIDYLLNSTEVLKDKKFDELF
jgi:hypothetical protein